MLLHLVRTFAPASEPVFFSIHREDAGRLPVFVVNGTIDAVSGPQLSAAICAFGGEQVVVDLSGVESIDAGGLRDLLLAARVLAIDLHVVLPRRDPARRLLARAGSMPRLGVHESRHDAVSRSGRFGAPRR